MALNEGIVLDGELAVPCNPQPAPVGSNSRPRPRLFWSGLEEEAMKVRALHKESPVNPARTGR